MTEWKVADAKARFSAMLHDAGQEPQVICRRDKPIAVVMSIEAFSDRTARKRESVSSQLDSLRRIQEIEEAEIEIPPRVDRPILALAE